MDIIKQPYAITTSCRNLSVPEERIFKVVIRNLQNNLTFGEIIQKKEDYVLKVAAKSLLPEGSKNYSKLYQALDSIPKKRIQIKLKNGDRIFTGLILQAFFCEKRDNIEITLSKYLMPILLGLSRGYTQFSFKNSFNLSSAYSTRIYEVLCHWVNGSKKITNIFWSFHDLQDMLMLSKSYLRAGTIEQKVLKPAMKELKSKADVWFSIESKIKEGRKVIGWNIKIHKKKEIEKPPKLLENKTSKQQTLYENMLSKFQLSPLQAEKILKKVNEKEIGKTLYQIQIEHLSNKVQNLGAYTAKVFDQKYNLGLTSS